MNPPELHDRPCSCAALGRQVSSDHVVVHACLRPRQGFNHHPRWRYGPAGGWWLRAPEPWQSAGVLLRGCAIARWTPAAQPSPACPTTLRIRRLDRAELEKRGGLSGDV